MTSDKYINNCRICGFFLGYPPWGKDGKIPLFEYCPCCGVEFGYQDSTLKGIKKFREQWINNNMTWSYSEEKPLSWDYKQQLRSIPDKYK
ncbi:hypothetical protein [Candidatus Albibeggiatoa sp. nov. NOAA]|uniref:hypothetical protein n=1 Tax=Candidatus Albibeggiatoa sp. nov. NOAA TaxID=3162724 RepID=UPI0032FAAD9D|nr:hypothetical protein [Thiotrichaceae bacterium]